MALSIPCREVERIAWSISLILCFFHTKHCETYRWREGKDRTEEGEEEEEEEEESTAQASLEQPDHVDGESQQQASNIKAND